MFDADNVVRRVPMLKRYGDGYYPALTLAVLGVSVEAKAIKPIVDGNGDLEWLDVGGLRIPVAPDGTRWCRIAARAERSSTSPQPM